MQKGHKLRDAFFSQHGDLSDPELFERSLVLFDKTKELYDKTLEYDHQFEDDAVLACSTLESQMKMVGMISQYHRSSIDGPTQVLLRSGMHIGYEKRACYAKLAVAFDEVDNIDAVALELIGAFCVQALDAAFAHHNAQFLERCKRLPSISGDAPEMNFVDLSARRSVIPAICRCTLL